MNKPEDQDMFADPEPLDDNDPDVLAESFALHLAMGLQPEDFVDPTDRTRYVEWLAKQS
jgi:hypothetical protein